MQPTLVELKIDPGIQIAGLVSLGYVFAQTCQLYLTNELINQMAKETFFDTDPVSERYSSALAAGFAVGLINLGTHNVVSMRMGVVSRTMHCDGPHEAEWSTCNTLRSVQACGTVVTIERCDLFDVKCGLRESMITADGHSQSHCHIM